MDVVLFDAKMTIVAIGQTMAGSVLITFQADGFDAQVKAPPREFSLLLGKNWVHIEDVGLTSSVLATKGRQIDLQLSQTKEEDALSLQLSDGPLNPVFNVQVFKSSFLHALMSGEPVAAKVLCVKDFICQPEEDEGFAPRW